MSTSITINGIADGGFIPDISESEAISGLSITGLSNVPVFT